MRTNRRQTISPEERREREVRRWYDSDRDMPTSDNEIPDSWVESMDEIARGMADTIDDEIIREMERVTRDREPIEKKSILSEEEQDVEDYIKRMGL
jgi:hypothetical protein